MFRALTVPNSTDTPVLILNPDMCTASIGTMRSAKSKVASLVIVQPSEIEQNRGSSYIEPTRTYDVLKRQIAVGSQAGGNIISMKVYMLPTSTQVSREFCQPETKSLSTEVLHLETLDTGIMFCILIEHNVHYLISVFLKLFLRRYRSQKNQKYRSRNGIAPNSISADG